MAVEFGVETGNGQFEPFGVDATAGEGDCFEISPDLTVRVMQTPGHTWDFLSYYVPQRKLLVSSEALGTPDETGYIVTDCLVDYDVHYQSMLRLNALDVDTLCLGHIYACTGSDARRHMDASLVHSRRFFNMVAQFPVRGKRGYPHRDEAGQSIRMGRQGRDSATRTGLCAQPGSPHQFGCAKMPGPATTRPNTIYLCKDSHMISPDLTVDIGGLKLQNPVMTASGTFGYAREFAHYMDLNRLGAIIVKGLSLNPSKGNPPPRIVETDCGMLNAIGLENVGIDAFIRDKLPFLATLHPPAIANIYGKTIEEYAALAERLEPLDAVRGLEVNISCPNVKEGGVAFGSDPKIAHQVVSRP